MKQIAIVTDNRNSVSESIETSLTEVLNNLVTIHQYTFDELHKGQKLKEDIVLVTISEYVYRVQSYVDDISKVMAVNRTILSEHIMKILSIPKGLEVLIVNDTRDTTLELITVLYSLGIKHLNFIPYEKGKLYKNIQIAITPNESEFVPAYIENIFNLGNRVVDVSTLINIIAELKLYDTSLSWRLLEYINKIVPLNKGLNEQYKKLVIAQKLLDTVMDQSDDTIVITNLEGEILLMNEKNNGLFVTKPPAKKETIFDLLSHNIEDAEFIKQLRSPNFSEGVLIEKKRYYNVKKKKISELGLETGLFFKFEEITYIRKIEQNLSEKLKENGHTARYTFEDIITCSPSMNAVIKMAQKIAPSDLSVLITGQSGTGKEVFAQAIHNNSSRHKQPFVAINCAAMPETLLESELFGYETGSFTGATQNGKKGLFEVAHNGTLFLDEIGDMPLHLQTKLLRVIQEKQIMRLGSPLLLPVNIRIIAATNKELPEQIEKGHFREDLYYRLNVLPLKLPSLRERREDIPLLLQKFTKKRLAFSDVSIACLKQHLWKGNIRELQNVCDYLCLMCENTVDKDDLPVYITQSEPLKSHDCNIGNNNLHTLDVTHEHILLAIAKLRESGKSAGRSYIQKYLKNKGQSISESNIRKKLEQLKKEGLITTHKGRSGAILTELGYQRIKSFPL